LAFGVDFTSDDGTDLETPVGYTPDQIGVVPNTPEAGAIAGTPCSPGDPIPPRDANNGVPGPFIWRYTLECMTPEEMHGTAADACAAMRPTSHSEAIMVEDGAIPTPTAPPSGMVPLCDLQATCGNAICDAGCEDAVSCAVDCASQPGLCADHGGNAWVGTTCVCPGIIDEVTICADNTKFDHPTDASCTVADPAQCQSVPPQPTTEPACLCTCKVWNQSSFPPTCTKWTDCYGNTCGP
jgi:hypothetical protein